MNTLSTLLQDFLPFVGLLLLTIGIKTTRIHYIITALWLTLIALLLHYQTAGGEILGHYFGYEHSSIYTLSILILLVALFRLFFRASFLQGQFIRYSTGLASVFFLAGCVLLIMNLWINAHFIENRRPGTPIIQVATFATLDYCSYRYIFYRVNPDGKVSYMCPNHYGVIPSIGDLNVTPDFVLKHFVHQVHTRSAPLVKTK